METKIGDLVLYVEDNYEYLQLHEVIGLIVDFVGYNTHIGEYTILWSDGQETTEYNGDIDIYRRNFIERYGYLTKGKK